MCLIYFTPPSVNNFPFWLPHVFGSFMEFLLEPTTINHSQTLSHESSLDLMDSLPTNDSHNNRAIIFSITGESVTFYQINLFKLRWKIRLWKLGHSSLQVWKSGAKRGSDELTNLWNSHALCASFIFSIKYNYYILLSYFDISNLLNSHALCAKSVNIFSLLLFIQRHRRRKKETKIVQW